MTKPKRPSRLVTRAKIAREIRQIGDDWEREGADTGSRDLRTMATAAYEIAQRIAKGTL